MIKADSGSCRVIKKLVSLKPTQVCGLFYLGVTALYEKFLVKEVRIISQS